MPPVPCRVTINHGGARPGDLVLVDPDDPTVAVFLEKGYLVPEESDGAGDPAVAESRDGTGGQGDADDGLDAGAAVGDGPDVALEPVSDS